MINKVLLNLKQENYLKDIKNKDKFVAKFCDYFSDINAIHPFRDGNGRSQRAFFLYLAFEAGYSVDFSLVNNAEWELACRESMRTSNSLLLELFNKIILVKKYE